jgi:hypothetical protein
LVAWKEPIDRRVVGASGMRGVVILPRVAYGDGVGGIPGLVLGSARNGAGDLIMLGAGRQHWSTIHVADLAASTGACWRTTPVAATTSSATD